jgi:hypothetical protein
MNINGQVGAIATNASLSSGQNPIVRMGNMGDMIVSELHGRFYEAAYRQTLFSAGSTLTALSANTITLSSTTTPIVGVWNPNISTVNLVIAQASLQAIINTLVTPVGAGAFVWAVSTANTGISSGAAPWNRKTLTQTGSQAKAFNGGVALAGLTNNLTIVEGSDFQAPAAQTYGTIVAPTAGTSITPFGGVQNFDGSWVIPPGGVLALLNTTSTTTMSVTSRLLWEEVPI